MSARSALVERPSAVMGLALESFVAKSQSSSSWAASNSWNVSWNIESILIVFGYWGKGGGVRYIEFCIRFPRPVILDSETDR